MKCRKGSALSLGLGEEGKAEAQVRTKHMGEARRRAGRPESAMLTRRAHGVGPEQPILLHPQPLIRMPWAQPNSHFLEM